MARVAGIALIEGKKKKNGLMAKVMENFEKYGDGTQASPGHPGDFFKHPLLPNAY